VVANDQDRHRLMNCLDPNLTAVYMPLATVGNVPPSDWLFQKFVPIGLMM
jgi:hypothetical protein